MGPGKLPSSPFYTGLFTRRTALAELNLIWTFNPVSRGVHPPKAMTQPSSSPFFPFLPFRLPFSPIPFSSPSLLSPPLPLEVGSSQIQLGGLGSAVSYPLSQRDVGRICCILAVKDDIWSQQFQLFSRESTDQIQTLPPTSLFLPPPPRGFLWRILRRRWCLWTPRLPAWACFKSLLFS